MIKINVIGDKRMIANSAWISTTSEVKAKSRSDDDVDRVVSFLAKNMHTSPFEVVSVSVRIDKVPDYIKNNNHTRVSSDDTHFVVDLLNFAKIMHSIEFNSYIWIKFCESYKELSEVAKMFNFNQDHAPYSEDLSKSFKEISVELIEYHEEKEEHMSRATWRVKCPLSISVQLLRHRTGSFNMVSGRYKTIKQEVVTTPDDISDILNLVYNREKDMKSNEVSSLISLIKDMSVKMEESKCKYLETMKELKRCKTRGILLNNEYKRMREYVRFILPEGRVTELYVSMYISDFRGFLKLRDSEHAQLEHIALAQLMKLSLKNKTKMIFDD